MILVLVFSPPDYCIARLRMKTIDSTCQSAADGTEWVKVYAWPTIDLGDAGTSIILNFCYLFLTGMKNVKTRYTRTRYDERVALVILWIISISYLFLTILSTVGIMENLTSISNIMMVLYLLVYHDNVRKAVLRMCQIMVKSVHVIFFYFYVCCLFAMFNRIVLFDINDGQFEDSNDNNIWFSFSNKSFTRALITQFITFPGNNIPGIMVQSMQYKRWACILFLGEALFNNVILINIMMSCLYFYYQQFYQESFAAMESEAAMYKVIAEEFSANDLQIKDEVLEYIVYKYFDDKEHNFDGDEHYGQLTNDANAAKTSAALGLGLRVKWYQLRFKGLRSLLNNVIYKIIIFTADALLIIVMIICIETHMPSILKDRHTLITGMGSDSDLDPAESLKLHLGILYDLTALKWYLN